MPVERPASIRVMVAVDTLASLASSATLKCRA
jgi:hypothetical protein